MLFQLRTDNHIPNSKELSDLAQAEVESALLPQFAGQLRRVEVYLQDMNAQKQGIDKRCSVEAHLAGHQPVVAHDTAATVEEAVSGAVGKLTRALQHTLGRLHDRKGQVSMADEDNQR
jgi:ribosome-associated translation inhibitor RaiA